MTYWIGASGAALFVLVFLVDGWSRPGYSPVRHPVSALALGSRGWIQTANFLGNGAAITVGALGVVTVGQNLPLGLILIVFGIGLIASGVFPMDPMRGYPPGTPDDDPPEFSARHKAHDYAGMVVFLALPATAIAAAVTMPGAIWTIGSLLAAGALLYGLQQFGDAWEKTSPHTGLIQKAVIIGGWLWLAAVFLDFAYR